MDFLECTFLHVSPSRNAVNRPRERPKLYIIRPVKPPRWPFYCIRDSERRRVSHNSVTCIWFTDITHRIHRLLNHIVSQVGALLNCLLATRPATPFYRLGSSTSPTPRVMTRCLTTQARNCTVRTAYPGKQKREKRGIK